MNATMIEELEFKAENAIRRCEFTRKALFNALKFAAHNFNEAAETVAQGRNPGITLTHDIVRLSGELGAQEEAAKDAIAMLQRATGKAPKQLLEDVARGDHFKQWAAK